MSQPDRQKLDGWKEIADYLGKDTSTAIRWERNRGMPIHRPPGKKKGATVYAFTDELDAWLKQTSKNTETIDLEKLPLPSTVSQPNDEGVELHASARQWWAPRRLITLGAGLVVFITLIGLLVTASNHSGRVNQVTFSGNKVLAWDERGKVLWEYEFSQRLTESDLKLEKKAYFLDVNGRQEILLVASFTNEELRDARRDVLYCFSSSGKVLWQYEPKETFSFAGRQFEGPWYIVDVVVDDRNKQDIWLAVNHNLWWPAFIVKIDETGNPSVRFISSGAFWRLSRTHNESGSHILAVGVNNEYRAGILAVLDENQAPSTSPQSIGSPYKCDHCPEGEPKQYFVFPRSELNVLQGGPYNPVQGVRVSDNQIELWSNEVESAASQLFYQLSKDLTIKSVSMSDGYVELHRRLSLEGKLAHSLNECPMLQQRYKARVYNREGGWKDVEIPWVEGQAR